MENPIKSAKRLGRMSYEKMAILTGFHVNTIYNLSNYTQAQIGNVSIKHAIIIKTELKIDLWKYFKSE